MDAADTRASPEKEEVICMRSITAQRLAEFTEQDYEFTFGITRKEFAQMLEALNAAYCKEHRRRPHFTKITMQDKLVLTLLYRREYRSMENIAAEYGVSRDTIADNIHWVERALLNANLLQNSVTCVYKTNAGTTAHRPGSPDAIFIFRIAPGLLFRTCAQCRIPAWKEPDPAP